MHRTGRGTAAKRAVKRSSRARAEAGTELREGFTVQDLVWDGERVTGIRGHTKGGATATEQARIVIGADGTHSFVARAVQTLTYQTKPALTCWYFIHWSGVPAGARVLFGDRQVPIACGTNDGLTVVLAGWPHGEFHHLVKRGIRDVAAFVALCSGREDKKAVGYKEDEKTNRFPDSPSCRPVARCSRGLVTSVRCSLP
jgi:2-polyprenyl-6-methoxyphenol hydroxylase-like FAD-dependent oxidoreductase